MLRPLRLGNCVKQFNSVKECEGLILECEKTSLNKFLALDSECMIVESVIFFPRLIICKCIKVNIIKYSFLASKTLYLNWIGVK